MSKLCLLSIALVIILSLLKTNKIFSEQLIIEKIERTNNFRISEIYFDFAKVSLNLTNFNSKTVLIKKIHPIEKTVYSFLLNLNSEVKSKSAINNFQNITDKVFVKNYLILDTNYQILNINNMDFYKFQIYVPKKEKTTRFINNILEQYKIEFNLKNLR